MKRDCGEGELIPIKYEIVYCIGEYDEEFVSKSSTKEAALKEYAKHLQLILDTKCSNIRLYAIDKEGYSNCIKSCIHTKQGEKYFTDKTNEL